MSNKSISTCFGTYKLQNELKSHDAEYEGHCLTTHKSKQSPAGCTQTCCKKFLLIYFALCIVVDVAALQFVGRSISVFLTFNILLCTVYLCWTWLHCSCWSLNIGAFSNYLTINQFYLFLCLQHSHLHTPSLPNLPTILVETWEPFH